MDALVFLKECVALQAQYQAMIKSNAVTKRAMCDLCVPFRDKFHLTDLQTLRIARDQMNLSELVEILEKLH